MNGPSQLKRRVLDALELVVKQFKTREDLYPLRVPREPITLDDVIEQALGDDYHRLDPQTLRNRILLQLGWDDGSVWELWVVVLPSGLKLFCDSGEEGSRVLASGGRNAGDASELLFLELLADSAGEQFGIEMSGGAPSTVRSSVDDREFLVNMFTDLFENVGLQGALGHVPGGGSASLGGSDFRDTVEQWLERVIEREGHRWRPSPRPS